MSKQDLFNMVKALMQNDRQKAESSLSTYLHQQGKELLPQITTDETNDQ